MYNTPKVNNILNTASKSTPEPPFNLLLTPLKISVVAFPNILGPRIEKIVLATVKIATIIKDIL